ncbi:SDR family NAD(P)-dependent oxidoreductase [Streptomyces rhizosphaericus]|uniref:SDR family NAD(P)-dependent oxidoreductase n=1 Tax=Streptomyces rhizosphaericus TaxID=114699 RepID=UPI002892EF9C|nr:SDR family NAD(P)-dependent oxidoreductase [Streptomyces rhizosphaericus]
MDEPSDREVRDMLGVQIVGVWTLLRAALPVLREQRSGRIVNVSSVLGLTAVLGWALYRAGKFGLEGLSEALAAEVAASAQRSPSSGPATCPYAPTRRLARAARFAQRRGCGFERRRCVDQIEPARRWRRRSVARIDYGGDVIGGVEDADGAARPGTGCAGHGKPSAGCRAQCGHCGRVP